ncbi:MAG: ribosomal protein S18-alanine N-acetyltransferase [Anaerolineae bacterium]
MHYYEDIPYEVAPMRVSDISEVMAIERQSFPTPWSSSAYRYELTFNANAHYYVVRSRRAPRMAHITEADGWRFRLRRLLRSAEPAAPPILGYVGFWLVAGEAHISTIAVHPDARRRGLGELLLVHVIETALANGADFVTLEVRVSNHSAQRLYEKYGFNRTGRRKGYYSDNREDAWIMTVDDLDNSKFQSLLEQNKRTLGDKLSGRRGQDSQKNSFTN